LIDDLAAALPCHYVADVADVALTHNGNAHAAPPVLLLLLTVHRSEMSSVVLHKLNASLLLLPEFDMAVNTSGYHKIRWRCLDMTRHVT